MIYDLIDSKCFSKDYRLIDQINGAGISVMNNIAEGFDSQSNKEFMRFLRIARRSTSEVQSCLYIAIDQDYINNTSFDKLYAQSDKVRKIIDGLIRYLKSKL